MAFACAVPDLLESYLRFPVPLAPPPLSSFGLSFDPHWGVPSGMPCGNTSLFFFLFFCLLANFSLSTVFRFSILFLCWSLTFALLDRTRLVRNWRVSSSKISWSFSRWVTIDSPPTLAMPSRDCQKNKRPSGVNASKFLTISSKDFIFFLLDFFLVSFFI